MQRAADPALDAFLRRHAAWHMAQLGHGPARAYPYAWRLPGLARGAGARARLMAGQALGLTLYTLGRFREALDALPDAATLDPADGAGRAALLLRAQCLCVMGQARAGLDLARRAWAAAPTEATTLAQRAYLHFLLDDAPGALAACAAHAAAAPDRTGRRWAAVLGYWARARSGSAGDLAALHAALAGLRAAAPARAAEAEAIHAEAVFHQGPRWAPVWLDAALEAVERLGQHHLKPRLLGLKARALAASGQLGEAARFDGLARACALRQGARLYL